MFALFNLKLKDKDKIELKKYQYGEIYNECEADIQSIIDTYLSLDGNLDAEAMEKDWFPGIDAQVFISHSSNDAKWARGLANLLYQKCHLKSFVDSMVWSHANTLLRKIDEDYCVKCKKSNGKNIYDYEKRNQSTSHVHMILQGALAKMISKSLCLIFINTPNSICTTDINDNSKTASPWIYNELLMANIFSQIKSLLITESKEIKIAHPVDLTNFVDITLDEIENACESNVGTKSAKQVLVELKNLYNRKNS